MKITKVSLVTRVTIRLIGPVGFIDEYYVETSDMGAALGCVMKQYDAATLEHVDHAECNLCVQPPGHKLLSLRGRSGRPQKIELCSCGCGEELSARVRRQHERERPMAEIAEKVARRVIAEYQGNSPL